MANNTNIAVGEEAQRLILSFAQAVLTKKTAYTEIRNKMEIIDTAYARYKTGEQLEQGLDLTGKDVAGSTQCGNVFADDNIVAPVVVAQVDSMVAYLADIFLSGYPLFPVVSPPNKRTTAQDLEVLMDDHAILGGYVRQLLLMLKDGVKYNLSALEVEWGAVEQFTVVDDFNAKGGKTLKKVPKSINKIKRLDMYNTVWDYGVSPGDISAEGDYAGYVEILSKTKLKRLLNRLGSEDKGMNISNALDSWKQLDASQYSASYYEHPTISAYISPTKRQTSVDWEKFLGVTPRNGKGTKGKELINLYDGSVYEKFTLYARILPADFGIKAPAPNTPQIWKFTIINNRVVVEAERIISANDVLPILFGCPMEDGLDYQTQSIAEGSIPFQEAATTLFNIRFAAARRAVSDRALYVADMVAPSDVNSPVPAAKIPVRLKALSNIGLDQVYKQIPFDMRGTETTISDARTIVGFSQELSGINGPQQGQFQQGNKSVKEWKDTMSGADNRLRLPAMLYECQVFTPLKYMLTLNIFQYGENAKVVSQRTGQTTSVDIDAIRQEAMTFRVADGYSPSSKMAGVDVLTAGMNMIMNSPILQQAYGTSLPNVFAHLMQLGGVRDLEQYAPDVQQATVPNAITEQATQANPNVPTEVANVGNPSNVVPTPSQVAGVV